MPGWPGGLGNRLQDLRTLIIDQGLGDRLQAIQEHRAALERGRIAQAFGAASEGQQEPSEALYGAKHRRAQEYLGNEPPPPELSWQDFASLGPRAVGGAQKMWQAAPAAAEALVKDPLGSINRVGMAGQAATDAIVRKIPQPAMRFNDPRFDQVKNAADLTMTVMGASSAVPAAANELRMGIKGRPAFRDFTKAAPEAEEGYVYHATRGGNAEDISGGSLDPHSPDYGTEQDMWPDRGTEDRSYWSRHPGTTSLFVPEGSGPPTLLRTRETKSFRNEGTGDIYSRDPVPAKEIEFFGDDGQWHPLTEGDEQLELFANKPRGAAAIVAAKGMEGLGDKLQGSRARDPRYWNPASATKLSMPWDEIQPVYGKGGTKLLPEQPFDWSQVKKGDVFVPLIGDRTIAGQPIIGYNDVRFENAVPAEGGSGFTRRANNPQNTFWAADPGASSKLANQIASLQQEGRNVFGATAAMGAESGDYALQNTRAAWEALKAQPLTDRERAALYKAINAKMKSDWGKDFPAVTDWPGMDKVTEEYWKGNGKARTKFAKALDTKPMADLGGPDMGIVRKIISDPKQYDAPPLGVGSSIVRLTGDAKAIHGGDVRRPHNTYRSQTGPGEYVGTLDKLIPGWDFFTDFAKTRPDLTRADRQGYTFMRSNVFQTASPEWLERIVNYASSPQGKKLGLAGAIAAGLLTADQAQEMFGPDAAATESPRL